MTARAGNLEEGLNSLYQTKLTFERPRSPKNDVQPFSCQLLKWIGNKQRFAHEIISYFPVEYGTYFEPFLGSGAVLGTLTPQRAIASDILEPLIGIWRQLSEAPEILVEWYKSRWLQFAQNREETYNRIKDRFNRKPNPADLLFLSRSCYGGVIRFRKEDGFMSTPIGVHDPVPPESLSKRVMIWAKRTRGIQFLCADFEEATERAVAGDLVYCDPPYFDSQSILYGAQRFTLDRLFSTIEKLKRRSVFVALSIDGKKKSGDKECDLNMPKGLFEQSILVNCGRSMLRRFQMEGQTLESEVVSDRLLLTWR